MKIQAHPFTQIDRDYIICSAELKKALKIDGEIREVGQWRGISPKDEEEGKSPETDEWYIHTVVIKEEKNNGNRTILERRRKDEAMLKMPEQAEEAQIRPLPQVPASCEGGEMTHSQINPANLTTRSVIPLWDKSGGFKR